jgi:hypothetical protein
MIPSGHELESENVNDQQPRTKEAANMSDDIERSVAPAGSHGVAAAWAAFADDTGDTGVTSLNRASVEEVANRMGWSVVPLYRLPALTDEEREAIAWAINKTAQSYDDAEGGPIKREAMRGLLQRTK